MSVDYCVYSDAPPADLYALTRQILELRPEYLETHIFHHEGAHRCRFVDGSPTTPQLVSEEYQLSFVPRSRLLITMIDNVEEQAVHRKSIISTFSLLLGTQHCCIVNCAGGVYSPDGTYYRNPITADGIIRQLDQIRLYKQVV